MLAESIKRSLFKFGPSVCGVSSCLTSLLDRFHTLGRDGPGFGIPLEVMSFVSEYIERGLLLRVVGDSLRISGLFGLQAAPGPLQADLNRLPLNATEETCFKRAISTRNSVRVDNPKSDPALKRIFAVIGPPKYRQGVVLPLVVREKVESLIYIDNGDQTAELCSYQAVAVLIEMVSLHAENQFLRRELDKDNRVV